MNNALKQKALMAIVVLLALYGLAVGVWFMSAESAWKKARRTYERAKETYRTECRLIARKAELQEEYESEKSQMPTFESGKATDTTWLGKMDEMAARNLLLIGQRQAGKEIEAGDVLELPIEVKSWEGSLEALVKFMHELENTNEGMFDITALNFKPSSKKGYLRGSFTLTCAYMREN